MLSDRKKVYLAFQGGGARGISHVGGLRAVEEMDMDIQGVAGTSAGAILAALIAAGYSHDKLFDCEKETQLLQVVAGGKYANPTKLFTRRGWLSIRVLRGIVKGVVKIKSKVRTPFLVMCALMIIAGIDWLFCRFPIASYLVAIILIAALSSVVNAVLDGLAPLSEIRNVVDTAIATRLGIEREVTFRQLNEAGGKPLKLVATNVTAQSLELFSLKKTPDTVVADAVTASICLPLIFKACIFDVSSQRGGQSQRRYLDGGLLSNLPMWAFDEERDLDQQAVTIAFGLEANSSHNEAVHWLPAVVNAIVAGPVQIHARGIRHLVQINLPSRIHLLDFDAKFDDYAKEIQAAHEKAAESLDEQVQYPLNIRIVLREIQEILTAAMDQTKWAVDWRESQGATTTNLRLTLFIQKKGLGESLKVAFEHGHPISQWGAALHLEHSIPGRAWQERQGNNVRGVISFPKEGHTGPKWLYPDSSWMVTVPIPLENPDEGEAEAAERAVVLVIDSPTPLSKPFMESQEALTQLNDTFKANALGRAEVYDLGKAARSAELWL